MYCPLIIIRMKYGVCQLLLIPNKYAGQKIHIKLKHACFGAAPRRDSNGETGREKEYNLQTLTAHPPDIHFLSRVKGTVPT